MMNQSGEASVVDDPEAEQEVDESAVIKRKFVLALIAYAALGVLAWTTLSNEPIRFVDWNVNLRTATLLILALFAFRAALYFWRTRIEADRDRAKSAE
ncbi:MAG: hypothetical protein WBW85_10755 [Terriglobales bacterium]